jgi:hypothetical protein
MYGNRSVYHNPLNEENTEEKKIIDDNETARKYPRLGQDSNPWSQSPLLVSDHMHRAGPGVRKM